LILPFSPASGETVIFDARARREVAETARAPCFF
jgi:hypothetical protein